MSEMVDGWSALAATDPAIARLIDAEDSRQRTHLDLIASENHCSAAVLAALGSVLTDKYAEGYPDARWYGGCERVDQVEALAAGRARELFGAEHANVQPHSGSQANMAVYLAAVKPGDTVLAMSLAEGGHLTHGHRSNFSGRLYKIVSYGVDEAGRIDYDAVAALAQQHEPALIVCGASAYSRTIDFARFGRIARDCGALLMADIAHICGLVAAGLHPSPVPHADFVTSTTHKTMRGPRGAFALCREKYARKLDSAVFPGMQGGPMIHVIAAKAVAFREAMQPEFRAYQQRVVTNAAAMADVFIERGVPVVSGGTDNHLFLLDLRALGMTGARACDAMAEAHITVNKNAIPNDPRKVTETSGIRIGSPAVTTRGLCEDECRTLAGWMADILTAEDPFSAAAASRSRVLALCQQFPIRH